MKKCSLLLVALSMSVVAAFSATLTVNNTNDSGPGSLRDAIANATSGDVITFDLPAGAVIGLTSGELLIDKSLTIDGPGATNLAIISLDSGSAGARVIEVANEAIEVTIVGVRISNGRLLVGPGGGLYNGKKATVTITNCAVTDNRGTDAGDGKGAGGICNLGVMTITGSTISGNTSSGATGGPEMPLGAGIGNYGALFLTNCTVSGNTFIEKGLAGGLLNVNGSVTVTACTIAGNELGGIYNSSPNGPPAGIHVQNSIVAGNTAFDIFGGIDSQGYNLIGNDAYAKITPATGDQIGTPDAPIDPLLGPLQNHRGPTETQALLPGSPAIDKGNAEGLVTDERGRRRPVDDPTIAPAEGGDNSDIGAFEVQAAQPLNISTRADVMTGENILDAGFIITGQEAKQVLIRGIGPSLGDKFLTGVLADPVLQLNDATSVVFTNDNWKESQEAEIEATGIPPTDEAESAIVAILQPGVYTAILSGKNQTAGVGLVEVYDLDTTVDSILANLSTRGFVGLEDNVMIGGFIAGEGDGGPDEVLIRVLGPSLPATDVSEPLEDPTLELHDADGTVIAANDNWKDTQEAEIEATDLAPPNDAEAAILQALSAGAYTAIVRGAGDTVGVALVEVYDLANDNP